MYPGQGKKEGRYTTVRYQEGYLGYTASLGPSLGYTASLEPSLGIPHL